MNKDKFIELVKKTRRVEKRHLTKKELADIAEGARLMEKLFEKWSED